MDVRGAPSFYERKRYNKQVRFDPRGMIKFESKSGKGAKRERH
jgi:hypothetical protein